jgi:hypothetical protein
MSFDWFDLDVVIAVVAAATQATTGFLGWRVTVSGVPQDARRKRIYECIFIIAAVVGVLAAGLAAHRSTNLIGELHAKMHIDKVFFYSPPDGALGPVIGRELTAMLQATNRGALPVGHLRDACELTISPVLNPPDEDRLFDRLALDQKQRLEQPNDNEVLQGDNVSLPCVTRDRKTVLTKEQFDELKGMNGRRPTLVIYVTYLLRYEDKLGKELSTEGCWHAYIDQPDHILNCLKHNH